MVIDPGGAAAREVYELEELRQAIIDRVDRRTLVKLFRLEKAVMEDVARVVYREVHISEISHLDPEVNARHAVYLRAVRVLDRSLHQRPCEPKAGTKEWKASFKRAPTRFDPLALLADIRILRKVHPRIRTILHRFPPNDADDGYDVQIRGDEIYVTLETRLVYYVVNPPPSSAPGAIPLPSTPSHPNFHIRHQISIFIEDDLVNGESDKTHRAAWQAWMYSNPNLDQRVVGFVYPRHWLRAPQAQILSFLDLRRLRDCEPVAEICMPIGPADMKEERFTTLMAAAGPQLRRLTLYVSYKLAYDFAWHPYIPILDSAFPHLEELSIRLVKGFSHSLSITNPPLSGLRSLRKFTFHHNLHQREFGPNDSVGKIDHVALGRFICGLGTKNCVYDNETCLSPVRTEEFNELVRGMKFDHSGSTEQA